MHISTKKKAISKFCTMQSEQKNEDFALTQCWLIISNIIQASSRDADKYSQTK